MKALSTCAGLILAFTQFLRGQAILGNQSIYEPFDYAAGSVLAGQGGWFTTSGIGPTNQLGSLNVPAGMPDPVGNRTTVRGMSNVTRLPIGTTTSGEVYFSFALRVERLPISVASDTIAGFAVGPNTATFAPKINLLSNSAGMYQLGLYKGTGTAVGALAPIIFSTNDTVFLVARYTFNPNTSTDDTCDLWLNPDPLSLGGGTPPPPTIGNVGAGAGNDMPDIDQFFVRCNGQEVVSLDELRIGTSWASVTPVPEPSVAALVFVVAASLAVVRRSVKNEGIHRGLGFLLWDGVRG